jgi:hypothetical protein
MNRYFKSFLPVIIIVLIAIFSTGCDNKEPESSSPFGPKKTVKEKILFDQKIISEIEIPEEITGSVSEEMDPLTAEFETPVKPEGIIISLELGEMPVELKEIELNNGTLHTRDYGYIDVLLLGFKDGEPIFELQATPEQILSLKRQIVKYRNDKRNLFSAVLENDIPKLEAQVKAGVNLNIRTVDEFTPLIAATIMNRKKVVQVLLDAGADVNAKDHTGWTALIHFASANLDPEIGKALFKAHADVNARGIYGTTALIMACVKGNTDLVKTLVAEGADLNAAADIEGEHLTALHAAESEGHKEVADFLKKSGAKQD